MKFHFIALLVSLIIFVSCNKNDELKDINMPLSHTDIPTKWWILERGSEDATIYLYNEEESVIERSFKVPEDLISPHALDFDGESLWVGGEGSNQNIYELSSTDGSIISTITDSSTEGIAVVNDEIYFSITWGNQIVRMKKDGTKLETISVKSNVINDIAFYENSLYYVANKKIDPVFLINTDSHQEKQLFDSEIATLYTLAIHDNYFVMIDTDKIVRFDMGSKEKISESVINGIGGWITAISSYDKPE